MEEAKREEFVTVEENMTPGKAMDAPYVRAILGHALKMLDEGKLEMIFLATVAPPDPKLVTKHPEVAKEDLAGAVFATGKFEHARQTVAIVEEGVKRLLMPMVMHDMVAGMMNEIVRSNGGCGDPTCENCKPEDPPKTH
jgi:hypothetical protein